jgi:SanA protein
METAAGLFKAGKVEFLILSGYRVGGGRPTGNYDESEDMRDALVTLGVPPERLYLDNDSHRTLDSMLRAHCISREGQLIVVSQSAHVARALFLAWASGIKAVGVAAAEPSPEIVERDRMHEIFARLRAIFDVVTHQGASCYDLPGTPDPDNVS